MKRKGKLIDFIPNERTDFDLMNLIVNLHPTVIIETIECPLTCLLQGIRTALKNWKNFFLAGIMLVALLRLEGAPVRDGNILRPIFNLTLALQIVSTAFNIIGNRTYDIMRSDNKLQWQRAAGHIIGIIVGLILLKLLVYFIDPFKAKGILIIWFCFVIVDRAIRLIENVAINQIS